MQDFIAMVSGYKTYIVLVIAAVDAIGAVSGLWPESSIREIVEGTLIFAFMRMGISKSGPTV
jgi:hypothetical protein